MLTKISWIRTNFIQRPIEPILSPNSGISANEIINPDIHPIIPTFLIILVFSIARNSEPVICPHIWWIGYKTKMETHIDELEKDSPPIKVDMVSECEETKIEKKDERKKIGPKYFLIVIGMLLDLGFSNI